MGNIFKGKGIGLVMAVLMAIVLAGCSGSGIGETIDETGSITKGYTEEVIGEEAVDVVSDSVTPVTGQLKVHYIDVGQGDATLLELTGESENYTMLIDTGNINRTETSDYLRSIGVKDIDVVVGTHPHADHIGQLEDILAGFNVDEVWMSGDMASSQVFLNSLEAIERGGSGYEEPRAGDVYDIGGMKVEILSPSSVNGDLNNGSISMKITYGMVDFIFTGDAEEKTEKGILSGGHNVKAKIMHLGHHGSKTSTIPEFFKAVNPEVAIYSAGEGNSYGHPSKEVVDRVQGSGVTLYGTDTHGTVIVTTDGSTYSVATNKEGTIVPPKEEKGQVEPTPAVEDAEVETVTVEGCVDINTATEDRLKEIVHIGDARVNDLIESRTYSSVDDMSKISGIGPARVDDIKEQGLACVS